MSLKRNQHTVWFDMTLSTFLFPHTGIKMLGKIAGSSMARNSKPGNTTNETKKQQTRTEPPLPRSAAKPQSCCHNQHGSGPWSRQWMLCAHLGSVFLTNQMFFIGVDGWLCLNYFWNMLWIEYRWQVDIVRYRVFFVSIVNLHRWQWFNHTIHKIEIREWGEMFYFSIWL